MQMFIWKVIPGSMDGVQGSETGKERKPIKAAFVELLATKTESCQ